MTQKISHITLGRAGEHWIAARLRAIGHTVQWIGTTSTADLILDHSIMCEVKSAQLTTVIKSAKHYPVWQFSFFRHGTENSEHIYFLTCWQPPQKTPLATFIIPGDQIPPRRRKIDIPAADPFTYCGRWAQYRERWDFIETAIAAQAAGARQLELGEPVPI
jgi:hypothetical protein